MARNLPEQPPTRTVIHYYPDPAMVADLERLNATQVAAKQAQDRIVYGRWKARQAAIKERDRQVRRFWIGFGAAFAVVILAFLALLAWWLWTSMAAIGAGVLAIPVILAVLVLGAVGGHRCVTIVQHMH